MCIYDVNFRSKILLAFVFINTLRGAVSLFIILNAKLRNSDILVSIEIEIFILYTPR